MLHKCPDRLSDSTAIDFVNQIQGHRDDEELIIDFSELRFVFPYATLLVAESIRELVEYRGSHGLVTLSNSDSAQFDRISAISYLKFLGFFQFVGLPYGNMPNDAPGSEDYIPIRKLVADELLQSSNRERIQEAVQVESDRIAGLIYQNLEKCEMLAYCFREVIRNVFEHANIDYCTVMAQKWHQGWLSDQVEIAIVDRGRGICESMSEAYELASVEQGFEEAIKPGSSRINAAQDQGKWDNTGFGLYIISELGFRYGECSICTNGRMLRLSQKRKAFFDVSFRGTAIKLRTKTEDADYFPNILEQIVRKGEDEFFARTGLRKKASKSSQHL